jgi:uncharacterized membrane protein (DUF485 family)
VGPRTRRAIAAAATLVFLVVYVVVAVTIADYLPRSGWVRLVYNIVVGVSWGIPLLPLIAWAERGRKDD